MQLLSLTTLLLASLVTAVPQGYNTGVAPDAGGYATGAPPDAGGYATGAPAPGGYATGAPAPGGYNTGPPMGGGPVRTTSTTTIRGRGGSVTTTTTTVQWKRRCPPGAYKERQVCPLTKMIWHCHNGVWKKVKACNADHTDGNQCPVTHAFWYCRWTGDNLAPTWERFTQKLMINSMGGYDAEPVPFMG